MKNHVPSGRVDGDVCREKTDILARVELYKKMTILCTVCYTKCNLMGDEYFAEGKQVYYCKVKECEEHLKCKTIDLTR